MGGVEKEGGGRDRLRRRDYQRLYGLFTVFLATSYELFFSYELQATSSTTPPRRGGPMCPP